MLSKQGRPEAVTLADAFCIEARDRIKVHFDHLFGANDPAIYKVAMEVLRGEHAWLEQGIVSSVAFRGVETAPLRLASTEPKQGALSRAAS